MKCHTDISSAITETDMSSTETEATLKDCFEANGYYYQRFNKSAPINMQTSAVKLHRGGKKGNKIPDKLQLRVK